MTSIKSNCVNYSVNNNVYIVTIRPSDYATQLNPPILPIEIETPDPPGSSTYHISVHIGSAQYTFLIENNVGTFTSPIIPNTNISMSPLGNSGTHNLTCTGNIPIPIPNAMTNTIILHTGASLGGTFQDGDTYVIDMISCCNAGTLSAGATVTFSRKLGVTINETPCDVSTNPDCNTVRIPCLNIQGQTLIDGRDIGDMKFTIKDEVLYYDNKGISCDKNKCQLLFLEKTKLQTTTLIKCCLMIVSVVRGKGTTLSEKVNYLYNNCNINQNITEPQFYTNIIRYAMVRYILSYILYGKFSIHYLLGKYYEKFITDLGRSRFCRFVEFFKSCDNPIDNVVGYDKYFKSGCDK